MACLGELVCKRCEDTTDAAVGLAEIAGAERSSLYEVEHVPVHGGPDGFHQVEYEGVARAVVDVKDSETGVEPDSQAGDPSLSLEERVKVVEQRVDRVHG